MDAPTPTPLDDLVLSEVHVGKAPSVVDHHAPSGTISEFPCVLPASLVRAGPPGSCEASVSECRGEQDASPPRKRRKTEERAAANSAVVRIFHSFATPLSLVGKQVWQGALALGDVVLWKAQELAACVCVEVGAGTGLAGVVAAMVCDEVVLTDYDEEVLRICQRNVGLNAHQLRAHTSVRKLDLTTAWQPRSQPQPAAGVVGAGTKPSRFDWPADQLRSFWAGVDVVLCADVIYDPDVTTALANSLQQMLGGGQVLLMASEQRLNFTTHNLRVCSPSHEWFLAELRRVGPTISVGPEFARRAPGRMFAESDIARVERFGCLRLDTLHARHVPLRLQADHSPFMVLQRLLVDPVVEEQ